ncbi:MAG TPA: hypothetical protein VJ246_02630 [Patescibacteria group bacterium]|nr:hypothetical protein [Patescibacteria group bacterium]
MSREILTLVDGNKIRNHYDSDFDIINIGSNRICYYKRRHFIPPNEVWLDHPYFDEREFLLTVLAVGEMTLLADYTQERARLKQMLSRFSTGPVDIVQLIQRQETHNGITVQYVNGAIVRKLYDPHFSFGGHNVVYPDYIPPNTIWIDTTIVPEEQPFVLEHERIEYEHMRGGMTYDFAHKLAVVYEEEMRKRFGAAYPGEDSYPWRHQSNEEIINREFVVDKIPLPDGWDRVNI